MARLVVASVSEQDVQRAADACQHLVQAGPEDRADLRVSGKPQSECNIAGSDEVIEMGEVAVRRRPMPGIALDERRTELPVVAAVPQFPE